jgi:chromosomal replication initiator protein
MIDIIIEIVCDYYKIPIEVFHSKTRKREIVQARQIAMHFAKIYTKESLYTINDGYKTSSGF